MELNKEVEMIEKLLIMGGIPIVIFILGWLAGRYLRPWLHENEQRLANAQEIAFIADRITDEMTLMFPNVSWDNWIDKAVDKLIVSCGLEDADVAKREIASQIIKKKIK